MKMPSVQDANVGKISLIAILINLLQILVAVSLLLYILISGEGISGAMGRFSVVFLTFVVTIGAIADVREAMHTRRMMLEVRGLDETVTQMGALNRSLRSQRHDYLNHLQVVYGLMEIGESSEAMRYIRGVIGDVTALGQHLKTANPPINALLMAKQNECEKDGILLSVDVRGTWKDLPLESWEICRVLSNLIDNARDALLHSHHSRITVALDEDEKAFRFTVGNNGPRIPQKYLETIFEAGFSGKGKGRGMGLYITRSIINRAGGVITVSSDDEWTSFRGSLPKGGN